MVITCGSRLRSTSISTARIRLVRRHEHGPYHVDGHGAAGGLRQRSRSMVITAFQSASGIVNLVTPTSAVVMGGLALAKVRYDHYLRFIAPLLLILLVACTPFVVVGAALS